MEFKHNLTFSMVNDTTKLCVVLLYCTKGILIKSRNFCFREVQLIKLNDFVFLFSYDIFIHLWLCVVKLPCGPYSSLKN